jgi:hypothetical protein
MSLLAAARPSRFVLVNTRLSTPRFSRSIRSTPQHYEEARAQPDETHNSRNQKEQVSRRSTLNTLSSHTTNKGKRKLAAQLRNSSRKAANLKTGVHDGIRRAHFLRNALFWLCQSLYGNGPRISNSSPPERTEIWQQAGQWFLPHPLDVGMSVRQVALTCVASPVPPKFLTILLSW